VNESNLLVGVDWWSGHDTNLFFRNYYYQGMWKNTLLNLLDFGLTLFIYEVKIRCLKHGMVKYTKRNLFFRGIATAVQSESWTQ
jgi:hypothetical protein